MEPSTSTPTPRTSAPQGITHFMSRADKLLQMERSATLTIADAINTIHGAQKMHAVTYESMYEELLDTHQRVYDRDVEKAALFDRNRILNRQVQDLKDVISSLNLQLREAQEQLQHKPVVMTMVCERCAQMELTITTTTPVAPISLPIEGIPTTYTGGVSLTSHTLTGLKGINQFCLGDSARTEEKHKWQDFEAKLEKLLIVEEPWTLILDDPYANSFVAPITDTLEDDAQLHTDEYERTWQQNEDLGLNDMDTSSADAAYEKKDS
ncbi:hypothetical protein L7F22_026270 [Adiantum nelumboides]|nr:hypothetical protein [Adiantum nelumboides]